MSRLRGDGDRCGIGGDRRVAGADLEELADLFDHDQRKRHDDADGPLVDRQGGRPEESLEEAERCLRCDIKVVTVT